MTDVLRKAMLAFRERRGKTKDINSILYYIIITYIIIIVIVPYITITFSFCIFGLNFSDQTKC